MMQKEATSRQQMYKQSEEIPSPAEHPVPISEHIGRAYMKFQIGYAPVGYAMALFGFLTFAKVWQQTFEYYGIPFVIVVLLCPIFILLSVLIIGHYMIHFRIQEAMQSLGNTEGNREFKKQCASTEEIKKILIDIKTDLKREKAP